MSLDHPYFTATQTVNYSLIPCENLNRSHSYNGTEINSKVPTLTRSLSLSVSCYTFSSNVKLNQCYKEKGKKFTSDFTSHRTPSKFTPR